jgi:hypothetical protein
LRDKLLATDEAARKLGREKLSAIIFAAASGPSVPPGRLLRIDIVAGLIGLSEIETFEYLREKKVMPARQTTSGYYYRWAEVSKILDH